MKRKVCVVTKSPELARKIQLMLPECDITHLQKYNGSDYDRVFYDIDTCGECGDEFVRMSSELKSGDSTLHLPFRFSEFRIALLTNPRKNAYLGIDRVNSSAVLGDERIKLTEVEMCLYERLFNSSDYVSREELLDYVWHGQSEAGVLNVYIHYLREKLEKRGEKIILSSRKLGYKLNEIYRR